MRRALYLAGTILIVWGGYGLFTAVRHPDPVPWLTFFVGAVALNDLIIVPTIVVVGFALTRLVGPRWRPYVVSGLGISGAVLLVAVPVLVGRGRRSDNPSIQPFDYPRGLLLTLALVWAGVAVVAVVRERLIAPGPQPDGSPKQQSGMRG